MEYFSAIKCSGFLMHAMKLEKNYAKLKKLVTKGTLYYSTHVKCPYNGNLYSQRVD